MCRPALVDRGPGRSTVTVLSWILESGLIVCTPGRGQRLLLPQQDAGNYTVCRYYGYYERLCTLTPHRQEHFAVLAGSHTMPPDLRP